MSWLGVFHSWGASGHKVGKARPGMVGCGRVGCRQKGPRLIKLHPKVPNPHQTKQALAPPIDFSSSSVAHSTSQMQPFTLHPSTWASIHPSIHPSIHSLTSLSHCFTSTSSSMSPLSGLAVGKLCRACIHVS